MSTQKILRCAIYTRKSSEEGLEQDFNSLHAQREACAAYIASQKHEGWLMIKTHYDDGGFSGGNMDRPGLNLLLQDIAAGKVNTVVVYKVDRLTRSLADFAKIIEQFDAQGVSFVSVTQQFNTTTSMGRLTLNVLLSFAQFEREVTGERIRDKFAASKAKGMWMGGHVPLGYDVVERKLVINAAEAERVRLIYRRYLEVGCLRLLKKGLDRQGIKSKSRAESPGYSFSRGALQLILTNPIYIGQIRHKDVCHPGLHEGIIDQALWDQVRQRMADNLIGAKTRSRKSDPSPLMGKLFDASGERLTPVHANKKGRRYRYYVSQSLITGTRDQSANGWRLPGQEIEQTVVHMALQLLRDWDVVTTALQEAGIAGREIPTLLKAAAEMQFDTATLIDRLIQRVELQQDGIRLKLSLASLVDAEVQAPVITRDIPIQMKRRGVEMRLVIGDVGPANIDHKLLKTVAYAHKWFGELASGTARSIGEIASREGVTNSYVSRVINLAFLAPEITESIIAGRQPAGCCVDRLTKHINLPIEWAEQKRLIDRI